MRKIIHICFLLFIMSRLQSAPIEKFPVVRYQPDGTLIHCYTSGDENFSWLHDEIGNIIIQDKATGYYRYVTCVGDSLVYDEVCSDSIISVRQQSLLDNSCWWDYVFTNQTEPNMISFVMPRIESPVTSFTGNINNIVVFVRFNDQTEFSTSKLFYDSILME